MPGRQKEFNPHALDPVDRVARFINECPDQPSIRNPVVEIHVHLEGFIPGKPNDLLFLQSTFDPKGTHGHVAATTRHTGLFEYHDLAASF